MTVPPSLPTALPPPFTFSRLPATVLQLPRVLSDGTARAAPRRAEIIAGRRRELVLLAQFGAEACVIKDGAGV